MTAAAYCAVCLRKVTPVGATHDKAPRHNNLTTGQTCKGSTGHVTPNPDPDTAKPDRKAPNPTPTATKKTGKNTTTKAQRRKRTQRSTTKRAHETTEPTGPTTLHLVTEDGDQPRKPVKSYPPEVKAAALARMRTHGLAAVHDLTDIPKPTLSRWAREANVDLGTMARQRTEDATLAVRARLAEARVTTMAMLEQHLADAGHYLAQVAEANAVAAQAIAQAPPEAFERKVGLMGPYVIVTDEAAAQAADRAMALAGLPLSVREAEGIVTRAVHDLQLLKGEATERGELTVTFAGAGIPRPDVKRIESEVIEVDVDEDDSSAP